MSWDAISALASIGSTVVLIVTALYVRAQIKAMEKDRYLIITNELFSIWESREFMAAQLWLEHRLQERTWQDFVAAHRAGAGEEAFFRVGSFYDRMGTLVRMGLVNDLEILPTIGGHAIAVWQKIEPLVREARRLEHSTLFNDFERMLPSCHECYAPTLGQQVAVRPFSAPPAEDRRPAPALPRVSKEELKRRLDGGDPVVPVDVRRSAQMASEPRTLPRAVRMPADEVEQRYAELPRDRELVLFCA